MVEPCQAFERLLEQLSAEYTRVRARCSELENVLVASNIIIPAPGAHVGIGHTDAAGAHAGIGHTDAAEKPSVGHTPSDPTEKALTRHPKDRTSEKGKGSKGKGRKAKENFAMASASAACTEVSAPPRTDQTCPSPTGPSTADAAEDAPTTVFVPLLEGEATSVPAGGLQRPFSDEQLASFRNDLSHLERKFALAGAHLDLSSRRVELRAWDLTKLQAAKAELEGPLMQYYKLYGSQALSSGSAGRAQDGAFSPQKEIRYEDLPAPDLECLLGPRQKDRVIKQAVSRNENQKMAVAYWATQWEEYLKDHQEVLDLDQEDVKAAFNQMQQQHKGSPYPRVHFSAVMYFLGQWGRNTGTMSTQQRTKKIAQTQSIKEAQRAAVKFWADRWEEHVKQNLHIIGVEREVMKSHFDQMQAAEFSRHTGEKLDKAHFSMVMNFCRQSGRRKIGTWKDYEAKKEADNQAAQAPASSSSNQ